MNGKLSDSISTQSIVVAARNQVSSNLGEERVILLLDTGMYYSLDPVGAGIWDLIQEPRPVDDLRDTMMRQYEVDREECERSLLCFLREMAVEDLIEIRD